MEGHQPEEPLVLSNVARRHVASTTSNAVYYVRARALNDVDPGTEAVLALDRLLEHDESSTESSESVPLDDQWNEGDVGTATGFAVRRYAGSMLILTVAHIIRPVYAHRTVVTNECTDLNAAFRFDVMCIHQERNLVSGADIDQHIGAMPRWYSNATVIAINSELDLLALQVRDNGMLNCNVLHNNRYFVYPCDQPHGLIPIAGVPATDSEEVLLHGWPELRNDSTIWATSSYPDRRYSCLSSANPYGYAMRLLELPGVRCLKGCSGGPIVNAHLQAVGVLHGCLGNNGYAIPSSDVLAFLEHYNLLEGPLPPLPY